MIPLTNHDSQGSGGRREVVIKFTQINGSRAGFYPWVFYHFFFGYPADAQKKPSIFWMSLRKIEGLVVHDPIASNANGHCIRVYPMVSGGTLCGNPKMEK